MTAYELRDFVEPTGEGLDDSWLSVISRIDPGVGRQVNFIPCEVVLCLCAMRMVDHTSFGSGSAARAPFPVPELARLFKRPNSSILAKMSNLDGSRPNGGKFDGAVYTRFASDPDALDALYMRILRSARKKGIGPDALPDFLGLLEPVGTDLVRASDRPVREVRWFDGLDGQVIVDSTHVWITREQVPDYPFSTDPRRAALAAVRDCLVLPPRSGDADGLVHILVEGADALPDDCVSHPETVAFGHGARSDFEALAVLLNPSRGQQMPPLTLRDAFLAAIDGLEKVATAQELVEAVARDRGFESDVANVDKLAVELENFDDDPNVTWAWVAGTWVVAGGTHPDGEDQRIGTLKVLQRLTTMISGDTRVTALFAAAGGTPLERLSRPRLAELWAALNIKDRPRSTRSGDAVQATVPGPATSDTPAGIREPARDPRPIEATTEDASDPTVVSRHPVLSPLTHSEKPAAAQPYPLKGSSDVAAAPSAPTRNARAGGQWRAYFDCAGFRTVAVCDPTTGAIEITKGELKGRRYPEPTAAAAAVIERVEPGAVPPADGWSVWIVDDGSGRAFAAVRGSTGSVGAASTSRQMGQPTKLASAPAVKGDSTASTADRGIAWFIEQVGLRGAKASRITGTRRTAVLVEVAGHKPVSVRVKTRTDGTWQASKRDEDLWTDDTGARIWAFVDLSATPPVAYLVPAEEVADGIRRATDAWVARDPRRQRTGHHAIELARVARGRDRWDLLGLRR